MNGVNTLLSYQTPHYMLSTLETVYSWFRECRNRAFVHLIEVGHVHRFWQSTCNL